MTDLISRLRHEAMPTGYKPTKPWDLLVEAADEIERLRAELANVNNEFGSQTADWPDAWQRVADLKQLANDRWRENERLRTVLQRIAEFPRQRNDELSIEGARALARAVLKEPT